MIPSGHPVVEIIQRRVAAGSVFGAREDDAVVGLVIEGGGMRGVVSAGMASALESLGLRDCFDVVVGTSAGAFNAAYFLAEQAAFGTTIYFDHIANREFIDLRRLVLARPIMRLEFLVDQVSVHEKPLDCQRLVGGRIPLLIVATRLDPLGVFVFREYGEPQDVLEALRASARVPYFAGDPTVIDGQEFYDGAVLEPIPYRVAIQHGCTHVLVLTTRPAAGADIGLSAWEGLLLRFFLRNQRSVLSLVEDHAARLRADLEELGSASAAPSSPPYLLAVHPSADEPLPGWRCTERSELVAGARNGSRRVCGLFEGCRPRRLGAPLGQRLDHPERTLD